MRKNKITMILLGIFVLGIALWGVMGDSVVSKAESSAVNDDELAYIDASGFINIVDPVTPSGSAPFTWRSPTGGYTGMATIDSNADGVDEIIAIAGTKVQLLTPFNAGGVMPQFSQTISPGFAYVSVNAGDFIPGDGGRDEIVVQRTDTRNNSKYSVQIYDGNADGTSWRLVFDETFGVDWIRIEPGDVDGLEGDELVMLRNGTNANSDKRLMIKKYAPADTNGPWLTLYSHVYNFPWIDLAIGNTHLNNGDIDEIVTSRGGVLGQRYSFVVFQYYNYNLTTVPDGSGKYYPYWQDIAVGDINASGDDEVFVIRDPNVAGGVSLFGFNWGNDYMPDGWKLALGRDLQTIRMGDVDGDGKAEIVVAQSSSYRIYWDPDINYNHSTDIPVSLRKPVVIALGNYDGTGISPKPPEMQVSPTSLDFEMSHAESAPPAQTFAVSNLGGGLLNISVGVQTQDGGDWLEVTPANASAPATFTVQMKDVVSSMNPGVYHATITVTGTSPNGDVANGVQTVAVQLTILAVMPELQVSPDSLFILAHKGQPTPLKKITIDLAAGSSDAISWYAYVVPAGDWWNDVAPLYNSGKLTARRTDAGLVFVGPDGQEHLLQYISWVKLLPDHGITPRVMQVALDMNQAPVGDNRVTILVDGGPGTMNRFQGVDVRIVISASDGMVWLPVVVRD